MSDPASPRWPARSRPVLRFQGHPEPSPVPMKSGASALKLGLCMSGSLSVHVVVLALIVWLASAPPGMNVLEVFPAPGSPPLVSEAAPPNPVPPPPSAQPRPTAQPRPIAQPGPASQTGAGRRAIPCGHPGSVEESRRSPAAGRAFQSPEASDCRASTAARRTDRRAHHAPGRAGPDSTGHDLVDTGAPQRAVASTSSRSRSRDATRLNT